MSKEREREREREGKRRSAVDEQWTQQQSSGWISRALQDMDEVEKVDRG